MPLRLPIDDSLFFKLVRVVNLAARPFVEKLSRQHALSLNEWRTMVVLASHPGAAAHEVCEHTGLDKMSVSRALAGLERQGRVERRADAADRRRALLQLTAEGRRLFAAIGRPAMAREAQLFAGLSQAERAQLGALVDRLVQALREAPGEPAAQTSGDASCESPTDASGAAGSEAEEADPLRAARRTRAGRAG